MPARASASCPEPEPRVIVDGIVGQVDATVVPRYAGEADVRPAAAAERGAAGRHRDRRACPFDTGVSYRPGARFGPGHIRESSRLLRPYNPALQVSPFAARQVADAGDLGVNPFSIDEAIAAIERGARDLLERARRRADAGRRPHDRAAAAAGGAPRCTAR